MNAFTHLTRTAEQEAHKAERRAFRAEMADIALEAVRRPFLDRCEDAERVTLCRAFIEAVRTISVTEMGSTEAGSALAAASGKCSFGPECGGRAVLG